MINPEHISFVYTCNSDINTIIWVKTFVYDNHNY